MDACFLFQSHKTISQINMNETWEIVPNQSVGPLKLGMHIKEYRDMLGKETDSFKRVPDAKETVVAYDDFGLHLTQNCVDEIDVISIFQPNSVVLKDVLLLGRCMETVEKELCVQGVELERVDAGLFNQKLNILLINLNGIVDGVEVSKCNN